MAIAAVNITASHSTTDAASYATASVSLTAGRLYILTVGHRRSTTSLAVEPTVTGASQTWTKVVTQTTTSPNTRRRVTMFRCLPGSGASGVLTIDFAGETQHVCHWTLTEFTGMNTGGTNGSGAIVQSAGMTADSISTGATVTLAAFERAGNAAHGVCNSTLTVPTVEGGYAELSLTSGDTENQSSEFKASSDTSVSWTWASTDTTVYAVAVELRADPVEAAAGNAAATGTAYNATTTIAPTPGVASAIATAYDATISYLPPPRTLTINSVDYIDKIRWDSFSFVECANRGQVGMGGFDVDDATNSLTIPALKGVAFDEPAAGTSNQRVFTGFTHDRTTERGPNAVAGQRQYGVELLDLNTIADDYILTDAESADRPAETDYARVVWLLTTRFNTVAGVASGVVPNSNTVNMDAVDYRGRRARDVLAECSEMAGKNWFIYLWTTATPRLFYDVTAGSNLTSGARISDVLADVDSSTTWAASNVKVHKSPDDIYSTVHLRWNEGTVTRTNTTTSDNFKVREISVTDMSIASSAAAIVKADAFLTASQYERVRVDSISIVVPAANVNDIRAGQRIEIKLDRHGISSFTYYRILERKVEPLNDVSYKITLTLADQVLPVLYSGGGRGGDLPYGIWEKKSNATDDGATVIIDRGGITITDGALTITDEFETTTMSAGAFSGSWADFVRLGLYNARFQNALVGSIQAGRTSDLPYWTVAYNFGTETGLLTGLAGGGVKATWGGTTDIVQIVSDKVPVQPGAVMEAAFAVLANRAAGNLTANAFVNWYQYDGSASATVSSTPSGLFTASSITSLFWIRDALVVPTDAYSAQFKFQMSESSHNAANSISIYAAKLQDIPTAVTPEANVAPNAADSFSPGSGTVSDFDPGSQRYSFLQLSPSGALSLTGIVAPTNPNHRLMYIYNHSVFTITLKHDVTSTAANRFYCPGEVDFAISKFGAALLHYDNTDSRWFVVAKA